MIVGETFSTVQKFEEILIKIKSLERTLVTLISVHIWTLLTAKLNYWKSGGFNKSKV